MSYILDALRKADAERERDPARGIHAQPATGALAHGSHRSAPWAVVAACAFAAVLAGYFAWGRDQPVTVASIPAPAVAATAPVAVAVAMEEPAPSPAVTVSTSVSPPPPAPVERMVTRAVVAPRLAPAPQAAAVTVAATADAAPVHAAPLAVVATPAVTAILKAPAPVPAPARAADRILAVAELPPDVQRDLPKLAITGGVHSDNAAQRMLIVDGKVMSEGQELAPGVLLEQIRPRSAVLRFRGLRYSVMY